MADQQVQTEPEKRALSTEYVVLRQEGTRGDVGGMVGGKPWVEVGTAQAVNAQAAIKAVAQGEGTFVAIPARSWKPPTRKVEKVERDIWS